MDNSLQKKSPRWALFIAPLVITLVWFFTYASAHACSCMMPPPPKEALESADAVFEGQVIQVPPQAEPRNDAHAVEYQFKVSRVWKGPSLSTFTLKTSASSAACGRDFNLGETYLVYSYQHKEENDSSFYDNLCSRTRPVQEAREDFEALDPGQEVSTDSQASPPSPSGQQEPAYIPPPTSPSQPQPTARPSGCRLQETQSLPLLFLGLFLWGIFGYRRKLNFRF